MTNSSRKLQMISLKKFNTTQMKVLRFLTCLKRKRSLKLRKNRRKLFHPQEFMQFSTRNTKTKFLHWKYHSKPLETNLNTQTSLNTAPIRLISNNSLKLKILWKTWTFKSPFKEEDSCLTSSEQKTRLVFLQSKTSSISSKSTQKMNSLETAACTLLAKINIWSQLKEQNNKETSAIWHWLYVISQCLQIKSSFAMLMEMLLIGGCLSKTQSKEIKLSSKILFSRSSTIKKTCATKNLASDLKRSATKSLKPQAAQDLQWSLTHLELFGCMARITVVSLVSRTKPKLRIPFKLSSSSKTKSLSLTSRLRSVWHRSPLTQMVHCTNGELTSSIQQTSQFTTDLVNWSTTLLKIILKNNGFRFKSSNNLF